MENQQQLSRVARGLVVKNIGGTIGWLARRWLPAVATKSYLYWMRLRLAHSMRNQLAEYVGGRKTAALRHVEIETFNRCNGMCSFCPVNASVDPRPMQKMPESFVSRLIDELASMNYAGYLGLFSNNEPLLDTRLESFAEEARKKLPLAFLNLSTNGSLLDTTKLRSLIGAFDRIVINNYHGKPEMLPHIAEIYRYLRSTDGQRILGHKTVEISLRNSQDILSSRGGSAPNRPPLRQPLGVPCLLPFVQMVVRPDGCVSLCCNDALGQATLGDLKEQSIAEVWNGAPYLSVRRSMMKTGRSALPLCAKCDFVKYEFY